MFERMMVLSACKNAGETGKGGEGFAGMARISLFALYRRKRKIKVSYAHPYFWASFVLLGER